MCPEDEALALSLSFAKAIACGKTTPELALIAGFLSSLSANIGLIIQNRNFCNLQNAGTAAAIGSELAGQEEFTDDIQRR